MPESTEKINARLAKRQIYIYLWQFQAFCYFIHTYIYDVEIIEPGILKKMTTMYKRPTLNIKTHVD